MDPRFAKSVKGVQSLSSGVKHDCI